MSAAGFATAAEFGLGLAESLGGGDSSLDAPDSLSFDPYAPITVDLRGFGSPPKSGGLAGLLLGASLDPSTLPGAILAGTVVGVSVLLLMAVIKK